MVNGGDGPTTELSTLVSSPSRRPRKRKIRLWLLSALVLAILAPPVLGMSLLGAVYWQARTDETRPVEAIVVMGTAQYNGRPSPVLRARLDRVVEVWQEGVAPLVVVTGGKQEGDAFTEAEASHDYLVDQGIPDEAIILEDQGHDSWQSLQGVADLLDERGLERVLIVSDGFHLLRLKKMAHDLGLKAYVTAANDSPIRPGSSNEFSYMVREVAGISAYVWGSWFG
jgi:uncharacterized SAM-binding protein YcdF (DUF218 family)